MSEEFGSDFISIVDDEGVEYELELLDTLEHNGLTYYALISADTDEESDQIPNSEREDDGLIILKVIEENGEEILSTPDDDDEINTVYNLFMERLFEDDTEGESING